VLVLDEPTNHLDTDSLESLASAVKAFKGATIMVSHNQYFMSQCCNEMWAVEKGKVEVHHATEDEGMSFTDIFGRYKQSLRSSRRR
jgi:ATPase subunit of ABC transporter with duplicated ATPase domains